MSGRGNLIRRSEELKKLGAKTKKAMPDNLLSIADEIGLVGPDSDEDAQT